MKADRFSKIVVPMLMTWLIGGAPPAIAHGSGQGMPPGGDSSGMQDHGTGYDQDMTGHGMGHGYGMTGPGMGHGYGMMGPGMRHGYGMMGPGMGYGYGMHHGQGPHHGMMGHRHGMMGMGPYLDTDLTAAQVTEIMAHRLFHYGNPRLRVGKVEERDDDIIVAEVETVDGSLVDRFEIDRHTGYMWPSR